MSACLKRSRILAASPAPAECRPRRAVPTTVCSGASSSPATEESSAYEKSRPITAPTCATSRAGPSRSSRSSRPSTIVVKLAELSGCRPLRRAPKEVALLLRQRAARRRLRSVRPSIIPSAARDEQIAPPPFRLPVIDQVAREKSWRDGRIAPGARNTGRAVDEKKQWAIAPRSTTPRMKSRSRISPLYIFKRQHHRLRSRSGNCRVGERCQLPASQFTPRDPAVVR